VVGTSPRFCPVMSFGISDVEPSGSATIVLISSALVILVCKQFIILIIAFL
jgi:hypothetical protein